jgi:hypothetical protein
MTTDRALVVAAVIIMAAAVICALLAARGMPISALVVCAVSAPARAR